MKFIIFFTFLKPINPNIIEEGMYCVSKYQEKGEKIPALYRARVEKLLPENRYGKQPTVLKKITTHSLHSLNNVLYFDYSKQEFSPS